MDKTKIINRLEVKLRKYLNDFEELQSNLQIRNMAFGSAGYLSKGSKNKLYKHREKIGDVTDEIQLTEFCLKIAKGEVFYLNDLHKLNTFFVADLHPEYSNVFLDTCFPIFRVAEIVNMIFERYSLPYKKDILSYGLVYKNTSGVKMLIDLKKAGM